jgi:gliding motility-associated lipoprotein GldH
MTVALTACDRQTVYNHFEHVPVTGWEKNDVLSFNVPAMKQDGLFVEEVGLRISGAYPFMGLNLIIDQTIFPSREVRHDTLQCSVIDEQGNASGFGISQYQYAFPLTALQLAKGDSLHISVRHDMKREILPGITDIGIRVSSE